MASIRPAHAEVDVAFNEPAVGSVAVSSRRPGAGIEVVGPWDRVCADAVAAALPWRTFRWHHGQKRHFGSYCSATEPDLVIYESRLELSWFLFIVFDTSVRYIVAQPFFLLKAEVDGEARRHVPDYLLLAKQGLVVVDIKPGHRVLRPHSTFTFRWTRRAVESKGWRNEVWNESPPAGLENVRFLAGFRRDWLFAPVCWRPDACLPEAS